MIGILLGLLIFVGGSVLVFRHCYREALRVRTRESFSPSGAINEAAVLTVMPAVLLAVVGFIVAVVYCAVFGCLPGYSHGDRIGYITKASVKGVLWKTNEIEMQLGSGAQASLQPAQELSVPDDKLFRELQSQMGRPLSVRYSQWVLQPWSRGKSGYDVQSFKLEQVNGSHVAQ